MKKENLFTCIKITSLNEYNDNFKTHELREILGLYNKIIQKNLFDIPCYEVITSKIIMEN